jgi:hypothetical protein
VTTDNKQEDISGRTYIKDDKIIWESGEELLTQIPIADIKLIGEYTTNTGPIHDDWFFVFLLGKEDIRQISAYAIGTKEVLKQFGQKINADICGQLAAKTDWKTNALWPAGFRGQEIFKMTKKQPTSAWGKLKLKIGLTETEIQLTDSIEKYLT